MQRSEPRCRLLVSYFLGWSSEHDIGHWNQLDIKSKRPVFTAASIAWVSWPGWKVMTNIGCCLGFLLVRGKTSTRSGVRTHEDICLLDLKSNALTSRPSWYRRSPFCIHSTPEEIYVSNLLFTYDNLFASKQFWKEILIPEEGINYNDVRNYLNTLSCIVLYERCYTNKVSSSYYY